MTIGATSPTSARVTGEPGPTRCGVTVIFA
jgi:hypothetical protein